MKLADVILYNNGEGAADGNNYWKKYKTPHYIYVFTALVLLGIGIGVVSLFLCSSYLDELGWEMFLSYLHEPLILLLNILPCVLLVFLFYFATGRAWAAFTFPAFIVFVLSLINYYKIRIRSEAFIAKDLALIGETANIISSYKLEITGRVILTAAFFIAGVLFSAFLLRGVMRGKKTRIIGSLVLVLLCALLFFMVYINEDVYDAAENDTADIDRWSELEVYVSKGFMYPFLNSIPDAFPKPPNGYDEAQAEQILDSYPDSDIPEDERVNVIAVMFEAFSDLSEHPEIPVYEEVYEPFHQLQEESFYGHLIANTFGGGTVDSERNFLTGYTYMEDYRTPTNSFVYYLREQGYYTEGFHPGNSWFYNRQNVEAYLGMENFYFLEDFPDADRTDEYFFSKLTELYDERDIDTPYFNFSVSYQNHGAYDDASTVSEAYLDGDGMSESSYNILNNYLSGIADTTQRMYDFVDSLRDDPEPVVVVFFGDHMPWLGDGNSVYNELGIDIDLSDMEGFANYYSTPYIIWANEAAKEVTGGSFSGEGPDVSACFLMDLMFQQCGWEGNSFMAMNRELMETVTAVNTGGGLYLFVVDGELTDIPEGQAAELLEQYQKVEYYMKNNFAYDDLYGG